MRRPPRTARSIFAELHIWLKATPERRRVWAHAVTVARQTTAHQRALIARHPDLADRLVSLYGLQRLDQWSGYVPPTIGHITREGRALVNRSPYREVLVELVAEAARREAGGRDG